MGASPGPGGSPAPLTNSTTFVPKATYTPLTVSGDLSSGAAFQKFAYLRSLNLQAGDVSAVEDALSVPVAAAARGAIASEELYTLLKPFEGSPLPAQLPLVRSFADVPVNDLITFGNALGAIRAKAASAAEPGSAAAATLLDLYNTAIVAARALQANGAIPPIGLLNLERLEMTPAGIERGGLLATVPLAPLERTAVVQQEWSVTAQEFSSIVTDSLENYSETGVTENTQLTQATSSQVAHSNQTNVSASASGGIGFVSGSGSVSNISQSQVAQSENDSRTHAVQTTQQASSRVKQSHKTSISISTTSGESEATTRILVNPSSTEAMRIDYFSLMRRWYVALYRYGLRLTYDITVPEPGAAMREAYAQLAQLQAVVSQQFDFPVTYEQISAVSPAPAGQTYYLDLASKYGAQVSPPPEPVVKQTVGGPLPNLPGDNVGHWVMGQIPFTVKDGYVVSDITLEVMLSNIPATRPFYVFGSGQKEDLNPNQINNTIDLTTYNGYMQGVEGSQSITYFVTNCGDGTAVFTITQVPSSETTGAWLASVWSALYNAEQSIFYAQQQTVAAQISALQQQIDGVDTLTLRREEHDEIMKCVLRWLLGSQVDVFMPPDVIDLFAQQTVGEGISILSGAGWDFGTVDLQHGVDFTGSDTFLTTANWATVTQYEDLVNFVNQAIDWDNITYFLYSYFWDVPQSWDFIRQIQHPDSTRQAFLRAGSARVVLTVRNGWELAWSYFVLTGSTTLPDPLPAHPYLTIAQQIYDYDQTNYPGIPAADPTNPDPLDDDDFASAGTTCDSDLAASTSPVTIPVADSTGFVVGATAIIDIFDPTLDPNPQEVQTITGVPDGTHITVAALSNAHTPATNGNDPFPVVQAGSKGLLIAEWFEYTPTSGTDIQVNSDLTTIA